MQLPDYDASWLRIILRQPRKLYAWYIPGAALASRELLNKMISYIWNVAAYNN